MSQRIPDIADKIYRLKARDPAFQVFGSKVHKYELRDPVPEARVLEFEDKFGIQLPPGYRMFLTQLGNGGAGPYYGLERLERGIFASLDFPDPTDTIEPSRPFPHTSSWNLDFDKMTDEEYEEQDDEYFDNKWMNGAIRICNYGCGVSLNLVVNGPEYGHIWIDDRGSDNGIAPVSLKGVSRVKFLDWYENWLDHSLQQLE